MNDGFMGDRRQQFDEWRQHRPVLAGVMVILGSLFMFYPALFIMKDVIFIGGSMVANLGLVTASLVFLVGVFMLTRPEYATVLGYVGIGLSIVSLPVALGGLLIGMFLSLIGSNLCIAWESELVE